MQERILQYINHNHMIEKDDHIIIGVSGGADSVCLFHVLQQLRQKISYTITVVHVNHGIRGETAKADEQFTKQLCRQYDVPYHSETFDVKAHAKKRSMTVEEAGRVIRRETFEQLAKKVGANKIALGHHQDDQAETVIFNLVRGSALAGLCGINPVRGCYIRPLLCVSKAEIESYLISHDLPWQIDETNAMQDYTRNKIRHNVIKYLEEGINPKAREHIATSAQQLQEVQAYLLRQAKRAYGQYVEDIKGGVLINSQITEEDLVIQKYVLRECVSKTVGSLKDLSKEHVESMVTIFNKAVGKQINIGKGFVIRRTYEGAILEKESVVDGKLAPIIVAVPAPGQCKWQEDIFTCQIVENTRLDITEKRYTKWLDYDRIKGDLVLRNRRQGDVIVTCAGGGKKKLKDYFIDAKIPQSKRDELLLLAVDSEVLWIVGDRISEKYKVTPNTKQILKIHKEGEELT